LGSLGICGARGELKSQAIVCLAVKSEAIHFRIRELILAVATRAVNKGFLTR